jgi:imidazolonepropionase
MRCDRIWRNARLATMAPDREGLGLLDQGLVACRDGIIVYAGVAADAPRLDTLESVDCEGRWITPGLIDCHTHLVYAGDRAAEFQQRLDGVSYQAIARSGGGILSTVRATRAASEGLTSIEIKSGYGLSLEHERKQLRAARALESERAVTVRTTFLGAHAVPPEFAGRADDYLAEIIGQMLPVLAGEGLVDAVDAFCETIGFSAEQTRRLFTAATSQGLRVKLHAEQLSNQHGAQLAASFRALSADHLEHLDPAGIQAMAAAGTVAVLLPGAYYFLRDTHLPPVDALRSARVPIALATDSNPGTSPLTSLLMTLNFAATLFRLTVEECLLGVTRAAALALGLTDRGTLQAGKRCDLAIWSIERPAELVYRMGFNPLHARVWGGT